ncbi:hypothetical protein FIU92_22500 (plasmid) [Ruegeria sp. THAF33]|nr:hypothetical protein FIU92_22500 [Ruegeria sp. THAF33]
MDMVGVDRTARHDFLDLGYADLAAHGGGRIEVARGLPENQVACVIGFPRLDDRQVGKNALFEDVLFAVELFDFLAFGDLGANTCLGVESGDACPASAHALGQRALRVKFQLQFSAQILAHELGILADVGRHHLLDLAGGQELAEAEVIDARIVRSDGQVLHAACHNGVDQKFRNATEAKASGRDQHPVMQEAIQSLGGCFVYLVHDARPFEAFADKRSPRMRRASCHVATERSFLSQISTARRTKAALLGASVSRSSRTLSSRPVRA